MTQPLGAAPVLSTPDAHSFEAEKAVTSTETVRKSDEDLIRIYEVEQTAKWIEEGGYKRIALQFPDPLMHDAPGVYRVLEKRLNESHPDAQEHRTSTTEADTNGNSDQPPPKHLLFILGDTSYGACCVDEVAAQHLDADSVIHYGRACLSPTATLPVHYCYTVQDLDRDAVLDAFKSLYPDLSTKVILMADTIYSWHLPHLAAALEAHGYSNLFQATIARAPTSPIPNRLVPPIDADASQDGRTGSLASWSLFHISDPPQALLLTVSAQVADIHIYPTTTATTASSTSPPTPLALKASTQAALRRRYAQVARLSRAPVIGVLVNTLSVAAYRAALGRLQARIAAAGKKHYVVVVGKLNAAKVANFAEVGGWVVLGCWESSLVEGAEFEAPVVTPFELEVALAGDEVRVWTGEWRGDFAGLLEDKEEGEGGGGGSGSADPEAETADGDSEPESAPPEFDLRTGRYVSHTRPMMSSGHKAPGQKALEGADGESSSGSVIKRAKGDLAIIGGKPSPGAAFLQEKRTWKGLGSDFEIAYEESAPLEEGRSGIAKGYENEKSNA